MLLTENIQVYPRARTLLDNLDEYAAVLITEKQHYHKDPIIASFLLLYDAKQYNLSLKLCNIE